MRVFVELSWSSVGSVWLSSSGMIRWASTLPSSTPHWSNESTSQIAPWVNTLCSYSATSFPSVSGESRVRGPIAEKDSMRNETVGRALGLDLLARLAEGQRLRLRKHVGHQHVVLATERVQGVRERDEVTRNQPRALMD